LNYFLRTKPEKPGVVKKYVPHRKNFFLLIQKGIAGIKNAFAFKYPTAVWFRESIFGLFLRKSFDYIF